MTDTDITAVATVGIPVTDQDRALEFYVDTLGLDKRMDAPVAFAVRDPDGNGLEIVQAG